MKPLIATLFIILLLACGATRAQNNVTDTGCNCGYGYPVSALGIGLVMAGSTIDLYNDSLLRHKAEHIEPYSRFNGTKYCPLYYKPDYGIMHYVCLGKTTQSYKVLVNKATIKYLPRTKGYEFKSWAKYMADSYGIFTETDSTQYLLKQPKEGADTVMSARSGRDIFCFIEMKGDWIKVQFDCSPPNTGGPCKTHIPDCKNPIIGWLRWKKGNKLLVGIATTD